MTIQRICLLGIKASEQVQNEFVDSVNVLDSNVAHAIWTVAKVIVGGEVNDIKLFGNRVCALIQLPIERSCAQATTNEQDHFTQIFTGQSTELLRKAIGVNVVQQVGDSRIFRLLSDIQLPVRVSP